MSVSDFGCRVLPMISWTNTAAADISTTTRASIACLVPRVCQNAINNWDPHHGVGCRLRSLLATLPTYTPRRTGVPDVLADSREFWRSMPVLQPPAGCWCGQKAHRVVSFILDATKIIFARKSAHPPSFVLLLINTAVRAQLSHQPSSQLLFCSDTLSRVCPIIPLRLAKKLLLVALIYI